MTMTTMAVALALAGATPSDGSDSKPAPTTSAAWRYIIPAPGDPFEHAPFRALVLEPRKARRADRKGRLSRRARASTVCTGPVRQPELDARDRRGRHDRIRRG